jgi:uncharacterized protein (DUF2062 family)
MDDVRVGERPPERRRLPVLTPQRIAAVVAPLLLAVLLRRLVRFGRNLFRYRRQLKLAFSVLLFLRQLRKW